MIFSINLISNSWFAIRSIIEGRNKRWGHLSTFQMTNYIIRKHKLLLLFMRLFLLKFSRFKISPFKSFSHHCFNDWLCSLNEFNKIWLRSSLLFFISGKVSIFSQLPIVHPNVLWKLIKHIILLSFFSISFSRNIVFVWLYLIILYLIRFDFIKEKISFSLRLQWKLCIKFNSFKSNHIF